MPAWMERMLLYGMLLTCNAARAVEGIMLCAQFALYSTRLSRLQSNAPAELCCAMPNVRHTFLSIVTEVLWRLIFSICLPVPCSLVCFTVGSFCYYSACASFQACWKQQMPFFESLSILAEHSLNTAYLELAAKQLKFVTWLQVVVHPSSEDQNRG